MLRGKSEAACLSNSSKISCFYPTASSSPHKKPSCVISFVQIITKLQPVNKKNEIIEVQ